MLSSDLTMCVGTVGMVGGVTGLTARWTCTRSPVEEKKNGYSRTHKLSYLFLFFCFSLPSCYNYRYSQYVPWYCFRRSRLSPS